MGDLMYKIFTKLILYYSQIILIFKLACIASKYSTAKSRYFNESDSDVKLDIMTLYVGNVLYFSSK